MTELHATERRQMLRDPEAVEKMQRTLDDLAARIVSARRQVDGCGELVKEAGRVGFNSPAMQGIAFDYLKEIEQALARLASIVESSGGRP